MLGKFIIPSIGCQNNDAILNKNISDVVIEEVSIRPKFPGETKEAYFEYIINSERFSEWQFEYPSKLLDLAKSFPPNKVESFLKISFLNGTNLIKMQQRNILKKRVSMYL